MKGGLFGDIKKNCEKKSHKAVDVFVLDEDLAFRVLFWTSVVQVNVVEQMNKEVDLTRLKKITHCNSRAHFLLKRGD